MYINDSLFKPCLDFTKKDQNNTLVFYLHLIQLFINSYSLCYVLAIVSEDSNRTVVYSAIGKSAVLVCNVDSHALSYRWRKNYTVLSHGLEVNKDVPGYDRYKILSNSGEYYRLHISNISNDDFGLYYCTMQLNQNIINKEFYLEYLVGKQFVYINVLRNR